MDNNGVHRTGKQVKQMIKKKEALKPEQILETIVRRRWFIIIPFCLAMVVGIYLCFSLPKVYEASTLILIQPQKVPTDYVRSVVSTDIESRISTISQQIMSRTNIEKIIREFELFSGPEFEKMFFEDKIESVREQISVKVTGPRRGAESFSISFQGQDPDKVTRIANTIASYYIDENLKVREDQAIGTSHFLEDELKTMRKRLEGLEEALKDYRKMNMGGLPEQLETNLRVHDRLQEQLVSKQKSLVDAQNSLLSLEKQMSEMQYIQNGSNLLDLEGGLGFEAGSLSKAEQIEKQIEKLKTRYTDRHPDVVRLKRLLANLEKEKEEPPSLPEFDYKSLQKTQRNEIKNQITDLKNEISKINEQINIYQQRIEDTPKREQELFSIKRDYDNISNSYNSLLKRKLEAEISVNMEKKQKGEQFSILDPAKLPEKPISPNMKMLFLMSVTAGLAIGGGLTYILEFLDTSFKNPQELESFLNIPVVATVPPILHPDDIHRQRIEFLYTASSIVVSIGLFIGFAGLIFIKG